MKVFDQLNNCRTKLICYTLLPILLLLLQIGCASTTTFRVLDAKTKEPIEGAVGLAMWSKNRGFFGGFELSAYTAKAIEAVSDKEGYLTFPAVGGRYAISTPHVKVYKPGYVGWDSEYIYLGHHPKDKMRMVTKRRENFVMKDQDIFLEPWRDEFTYISHYKIINTPPDIHKILYGSRYLEAIWNEAKYRERERKKIKL